MNIRVESESHMLEYYLQRKYPNTFVVIVRQDFDVEGSVLYSTHPDRTHDAALKIAELTQMTFDEIYDKFMLDSEVYLVLDGATREEAHEIFNQFPEETMPYTQLFGPVDYPERYDWLTDEQKRLGVILSENT